MDEILQQPHEHEVVLIDLSSIAHPIWHMSQSEPDPNRASQQIVARVRALANGHLHVAVCCDSGRSFRKDIADTYKANRPPAEAMLGHQIDLAKEQLAADGFPIWSVRGFEADDLIASAAARSLAPGAPPERRVLVISADKDLLQLVDERVRVMSSRDGAIFAADEVKAKFGVGPGQMRDYLSLVGDSSDNVKGVKGVGPKKAADLLTRFGTIEGIYAELNTHGAQAVGLAVGAALREFEPFMATTRDLITLKYDVDLPFDEILAPRTPKEVTPMAEMDEDELDETPAAAPLQMVPPATEAMAAAGERVVDALREQAAGALAVRPVETVVVEPAEYERQLDPRSMKDAIVLSKNMFASRMFSAYGTEQGVLSTVMLGRELGLPAMASLRGIHVIEGRHALSAQTMVALILKSGLAEFFEPVEFSATKAVWVTKRKGARKEINLEHTIEMATVAGLVKPNSNWLKVPVDMLNARCQSRLARMVYPDIVGGLYTPDELSELREQVA